MQKRQCLIVRNYYLTLQPKVFVLLRGVYLYNAMLIRVRELRFYKLCLYFHCQNRFYYQMLLSDLLLFECFFLSFLIISLLVNKFFNLQVYKMKNLQLKNVFLTFKYVPKVYFIFPFLSYEYNSLFCSAARCLNILPIKLIKILESLVFLHQMCVQCVFFAKLL